MIRLFKRHRAVGSYFWGLSGELSRRFGRKHYYSVAEVSRTAQDRNFDMGFIAYAHAMFCSRCDFDAHYTSLVVACTYDEHVCGFWSNSAMADWASITVFRASGASAREAAEGFAASVRQTTSSYSQKRFAPCTTKAGDTGYLVVFEAQWEKGGAMASDLFFHVGAKGAIRISIMTRAGDSTLHETLHPLPIGWGEGECGLLR